MTAEDAERHLKAVAEARGVAFNPEVEPAYGFRHYGVEELPVLTSESIEPPLEDVETPLTREEFDTWQWPMVRDVPGGLSAEDG